jgi:alpha-L-fucosidase
MKLCVELTGLLVLWIGLSGLPVRSEENANPQKPWLKARPEQVEWWQSLRYGMFIHWGPVSLRGTEIGWSRGGERRDKLGEKGEVPVEEYDTLYTKFNPTEFNPDEWVRIAKEAGMRYMVLTTRHHDGFALFETKYSDYGIMNPKCPYRKDIVRMYVDACRRANMPVGFYYSQPDWHHPDYRTENHAKYLEYMHGQVRELMSNYGKIDMLWFDGLGGTEKDWEAERLFKMIRELQPDIIINDRCGLPADHDTPEQRIGGFNRTRAWETCMTICKQWSFKPNDPMKSLEECLRTLLRTVGGDGNLLFNVGPMPDGRIEPRQVERLLEEGKWLKQYGESVYGTRGGPFKPGKWGASTHKGNRIFVQVFEWPETGPLVLPSFPRKVQAASLFGGTAVRFEQTAEAIRLDVPKSERKTIVTPLILELDGPAGEIEPLGVNTVGPSLAQRQKEAPQRGNQPSSIP